MNIKQLSSDGKIAYLIKPILKVLQEAEKEALAEIVKLRNEMRKEEIMEAVIKSERSYAEILAFIKGENTEE